MIKSIATAFWVIAATALVATAAVGEEPAQRRFSRDGQTYVYTTTPSDAGTVIEGRRLPSGSAFRLVVRGDNVKGVSGGHPVAFRVAEAKGAATLYAAR